MMVIYEDERTVAFLPEKPLVLGHVRVIPKEGFLAVDELPEGMVAHYFMVAGSIASALFDGLGAEGTNIIMNDSPLSPEARWCIDVIPRMQGDGKDFKWEGKKRQDQELEEVKKKIAWEFIPPEKRQVQEKSPILEKSHIQEKVPEKIPQPKDDYLIKFYQKIP